MPPTEGGEEIMLLEAGFVVGVLFILFVLFLIINAIRYGGGG